MSPQESRDLFALIHFAYEQHGRGRVPPKIWESVQSVERMYEREKLMRPQLLTEVKHLAVKAQFERESG